MFGSLDKYGLASWLDALAWVDPSNFEPTTGSDDVQHALSSVEIKTSVASSSIDRSLSYSSPDKIVCSIRDDIFVEKIPLAHFGKILQLEMVLDVE